MKLIDTFSSLRNKEVVNIPDGSALGCVSDLEFNCVTGQILRLVLPGEGIGAMFSSKKKVFVGWEQVERIGDDVILVRIPGKCLPCGENSPGGDRK